ncbi:ATP-binding protein [Planomonospora sp. ID91781]|uniref:sensor histidine kinase n=1 Tax=Planomonospora sp. ID91781 TaxID=2738135 RepID=UPI0035A956B4
MSDEPLLPRMRTDELLAELQERLQVLAAAQERIHTLLEAVISIGGDLDLETVLRRIIEAATRLADARYGALGVIGEGGTLKRFIPVGMSEQQITAIDHWPRGEGLLGLLVRKPQTLRLADMADHPASHGFPAGHPPMRSFLGVPIRVREEVFGNLYLTEKRSGGPFGEEDQAVVTALATAAGVAIANARLYEETRRREAELHVFAGVVAHDLKRPISVMRGFTEITLESLAGQRVRREDLGHLQRVLAAAGQMSRLIDDLLIYATARDAALPLVDVDVARLVRQIVDDHLAAAETAEAVPQVYLGALPPVRGNPPLLRQLFDNLIGNAIKYTPAGQAARVDVTGEPAGSGWVQITVADRGIGIPPGEHEAIFTGFHRVASTYTGTGLGLAICQRVIERHGGTITADDNPGGGARFTFTLPAASDLPQR